MVIYPPPPSRPCEGGSDLRPCADYNSAWSHFWISEPTHRHERTDWRLGMEDWHEKAWTANQNQRDRLPRKDGAGASDCGRSAVHTPSTPPSLPWHSIASRCCYGVDVRLPGHREHIRRDSLKPVTYRSGRVTLVHLNARSSESWRGTTNFVFLFDR